MSLCVRIGIFDSMFMVAHGVAGVVEGFTFAFTLHREHDYRLACVQFGLPGTVVQTRLVVLAEQLGFLM